MTPPPEPLHRRPPRRWLRVLWATVAVFVALAWVFDWTWCRPLVRHYVRVHADRAIDFEHLHVGLAPDLSLRIEVRGLHIENAAWAAKRPFIDAGLVRADIDWRSLIGPHVIVTRALLVDAQVDMERSADGLRNWRLSKPLDRGPGRIRVLALDATRSTLHVADEGLALAVELQFAALTPERLPAALNPAPTPAFAKHLAFQGHFGGRPFDGEAAVGNVISFRDTGAPFAVRGEWRSGATRVRFDGSAADLQQSATLDLELRLSNSPAGKPRSAAAPLPISASGHLVAAGGHWTLDGLDARLGRTDLRGRAQLDEADADHARARASATLHSTAWHADELAALAVGPGGVGGGVGQSAGDSTPLALPAVDAAFEWQVDKLLHPALPWLQSLHLRGTLDQGHLTLKPLVRLAANGRAEGTLTLDTTVRPAAMALAGDVSGVQVGQWTPALHGVLHGHVALLARADSWPALTRAAAGTATFALRDASVSNRLDARLALDGGAVLAAQFSDARHVAMPCARLSAQVAGGRLTLNSFAAETDRAVFVGSGALNLPERSIELLVTPHRKTAALFALNRSIRVSGPLGRPSVVMIDAPASTVQVACATTG